MVLSLMHHLHALVVVTGPVVQVCILGLALGILLSITMCAVDAHKGLPFGLEHGLCGILVPAVDEVAVEAVSLTKLSAEISTDTESLPNTDTEDSLTSPQASLIGDTPFQPPRITLLVSYLTENLNDGILFIFPGHLPPLAPEYA